MGGCGREIRGRGRRVVLDFIGRTGCMGFWWEERFGGKMQRDIPDGKMAMQSWRDLTQTRGQLS